MAAKKKSLTITGPHEIVTIGNDEILVLGTAHVSAASIQDVESAIESWQPTTIAVELCRSRYDAITDPDRWKKMDLTRVIKEKKLALLASNLVLASFQKKIGDQAGISPGAEMKCAMSIAEKKGIDLVLIDRDIRLTLSRAWSKVGFFSKMWMGSNLFASLLVKEEVDISQIEELKQKDILQDLFSNLPRRYQPVKDVILDERDAYLSESSRRVLTDDANVERVTFAPTTKEEKQPIRKATNKSKRRILAVIGAAHLPGMVKILNEGRPVDLDELKQMPSKRPWRNLLIWVAASVFLFLAGLYMTLGGQKAVEEVLLAWVVARSVGAGIGAILSLAHPLTILITVVMAPVVPLIPGSRLWMFSALTEVWKRKPRVEDFESIAVDTDTVKGLFSAFYRNRVLHLFWVTSLVSFGLTIGNLEILRKVLAGLFQQLGFM